MSHNTILGWFVKSGPHANLSRKFHNLSRTGKEFCLILIAQGEAPEKAISKARKI